MDEEEVDIDDNGNPKSAVISQSFLIASSLSRALGAEDLDKIDPMEYAEKASCASIRL